MFELIYRTVEKDCYVVHLANKSINVEIYWPNTEEHYRLTERMKKEIVKFLV